jgi:hypothetical protein
MMSVTIIILKNNDIVNDMKENNDNNDVTYLHEIRDLSISLCMYVVLQTLAMTVMKLV